jgi:hypothetical protein
MSKTFSTLMSVVRKLELRDRARLMSTQETCGCLLRALSTSLW